MLCIGHYKKKMEGYNWNDFKAFVDINYHYYMCQEEYLNQIKQNIQSTPPAGIPLSKYPLKYGKYYKDNHYGFC